jgi:hypothetical protein
VASSELAEEESLASKLMPILLYAAGVKPNAGNLMCVICLSNFEAREHVRVLHHFPP